MYYSNKSLLWLLVLFCAAPIYAYKEITGRLERASGLTREEINALRPLFNELQQLYDHIASEATQNGLSDDNVSDAKTLNLYTETLQEFEQHFDELLQRQHASESSSPSQLSSYNTTLPTVAELMGQPLDRTQMSAEELNEQQDIEAILTDVLSEAQLQIDSVVQQALQLESQLIKINKPKIVEAVLDALGVLFQIAVRISRAAYCTYSHIPHLNESLHHIYDGVDCYTYTTGLVLRIQHETVQTVSTIKKDVFNLADVYKKVAAKHSILGKLSALLLNVLKIQRNIKEAVVVGLQTLNHLQNDLPGAAQETVNCGLNFVDGLPQMIETVTNVTTCILFVDDTTNDYDFMKPELERDFDAIV